MALNKIEFATNKPVEVVLAFPQGKEVESRFGGTQWMFTTAQPEQGILFLPNIVAQKIHGLGLADGEPLTITKAEKNLGNGRKTIQWEVERVGQPPEGPQKDGTFAVAAPQNGNGKSGAGVGAPAPDQANGIAVQRTQQQPQHNTQQPAQASSAPVPPPHAAGNPTPYAAAAPWTNSLIATTNALIDVYARCVVYAGQHGNTVRPEDVRALMTTAFISMGKGGSR